MKIILSKDDKKTRVKDIQRMFGEKFPFLKLEFFRKSHSVFEGSPKSDLLNPDTLLCEILQKDGNIDISENQTVQEVERLFENHFGLHVQVFRKAGKNYLETSVTDNWTLKKQNETGQEISDLTL